MKKTLSVILVLVMLASCATVGATALRGGEDELPFELVAPGNVTAVWLEGGDSPTTTKITYSLSNDMTTYFQNKENALIADEIEAFFAQYDFDDLWITTQVDWAVDDVDDAVCGWHYNEYWDANGEYSLGYDDEGRCRVGEWDGVDMWVGNATMTVNDFWVTRWVSEDAFNGNPDEGIPGIKDQMYDTQYTYEYDEEAEEYVFRIDYSEHTVYFRMRFLFTAVHDGGENEYFYSDWSNVASVGKDAEVFEPLTQDDLPAPVITGLRMTDEEFNDNPVVAYTLTVPDELATNVAKLEAFGGRIWIYTQARVQGDTEWVDLQGDWIVKAGEMKSDLFNLVSDERPVIDKGTVIELRCRYGCEQPGIDGEMYSDWSKTISFGTDDIEQGPYARYDLAFEIADVTAKNITGKIVPVEVSIAKNNGYISGFLEVTWSSVAFALKSVDYSDIAPMNTAVLVPGQTAAPEIENTGIYRIYLGDHVTQGLDNITGVGPALTLNFEILSDASNEEYPITISNTEFQQTDIEADDLLVATVGGKITLTQFNLLLGDVDLDEKVDIFDASSIQKSIAGMAGYHNYSKLAKTDIDFRIADVDKDGKVDVFDASLIQKWIAGNTEAQTYGIGEPMK